MNSGAPLRAAIHAYERGNLDQAEQLLAPLLAAMPADPNVLHLAGAVAFGAGRLDEARARILAALAGAPRAVPLLRLLGEVGHATGDLAVARDAWRTAGIELGDLLKTSPDSAPLLQALIETAARASEHALPEADPQRTPAEAAPLVSFIICSIDDARYDRVAVNLARRCEGRCYELVRITDARSLCDGYARGAAIARGERLVFCHDDIEIVHPDPHPYLVHLLDRYDVIGVAGTTRLEGPGLGWSGSSHLHSWVAHRRADGGVLAGLTSGSSGVVEHAHALDGVFIAARRSAVEQLGFDSVTFDGFHFYDLDFSYRAHRAGLRVAIALDLLLIHDSFGRFDAVHARYADRFCAKFGMPLAESKAAPFFVAPVRDAAQLRLLHAQLAEWLNHNRAGNV